MNSKEAKEFIVARVIRESELDHVPLSDIERKMLYFTEVHPSLPDIYEVAAEFERDYDSDEYEAKVTKLLKNARERDGKGFPSCENEWKEALETLGKEDHYLLVMTGGAFHSELAPEPGTGHRMRDFLLYILIGAAIVLLVLLYASYHA
jgi:hypothetical protein